MIFYLLASLLSFPQIHPDIAAPTSITVGVSANPVLLGQTLIMTAAIQPSGATGTVTFYSGAAFLGTAMVSAGQAVLSTALLPAGANVLTARFDQNSSFATSLSSPLALTVAVAPGTGFPGGAIFPVGVTPVWVVTADLNNDGIADLITANAGDGKVSIFLGNGDGTFQQMPDVPTGTNPMSIAVADFNADGFEDLAVVNSGDPSITILLGNGDGTFQTLASMFFGSDPVSAAVADFNGDGIADIAVVDNQNDTLTVLTGNGDGTFVLGNPVPLAVGATEIAVADFNNDGKPDVAIVGSSPDGVAEYLGNGDGTFTFQSVLNAGTGPASIAVGDFNGDGKTDIAVGDFGDSVSFTGGGVQILLGNGNGTFQAPIVAVTGPNVLAIAAADFDGNGDLDLGVISFDGTFSTYPGNGNGTLQGPQTYPAGDSPDALVIGSFDGAALTEAAVINRNENLMYVLTGSAGTCSFTLSPGALIYGASEVTASVSLGATATGCPWSASSDAWIVPQASSGLGGGPFGFQIEANTTGADRTGTLMVGGQAVSITQRFTAQQFSDVPASSYQFDGANLLAEKGITNGCDPGLFCPTADVTRAQMAIFIVRSVYGGDNFTYPSQPIFSDVEPSTFGFKWIQKLSELGITNGCSTGFYCPTSSVTRAQMAVFIIRGRFGSTALFSSPSTPYFTDVPTGAFAFEWIQRMRFDGITNGCTTTTYCPTNYVVRGDMAIFIMRGLFNDLYPAGTPALISVSPSVLVRGQTTTLTLTGSGTNFVQGQTTVSTVPNVSVSNVQVLSPTVLTVDLNAAESAPVQPVGLVAITGAEQDVLPNGIAIQ
jgi:hypothetical protein